MPTAELIINKLHHVGSERLENVDKILFLLHILIFQALFIEFSTIQFLFLGHNEANLFVI